MEHLYIIRTYVYIYIYKLMTIVIIPPALGHYMYIPVHLTFKLDEMLNMHGFIFLLVVTSDATLNESQL